jgi:uncharacterized delta-60 repeat protein
MFFISNDPGPWSSYLSRSDNKNLPLMEVRDKYLREQLLFEQQLSFIQQQQMMMANSSAGGGSLPQSSPFVAQYILDNTFTVGTGFTSSLYTLQLQSDEKILAGGFFTSYNSTPINSLVKLNSDGTLDPSFNTGGGLSTTLPVLRAANIYTTPTQSDNKILIGGTFDIYSGSSVGNNLIRVNENGTIDSSFNVGDGFYNTSISDYGVIQSVKIQSDGKILAGGFFNRYSGSLSSKSLIRLNSNGTIDSSFNTGEGFGNFQSVNELQILPDNKILVSGFFSTYSGSSVASNLIKLNTDGTIDPSLSLGSSFNSSTSPFKIQSDNKIIIGGFFTSYDGITANRIVRLNEDGTLDPSFNTGTGFNDSVLTIQILPGDKILVGGNFTSYNGTTVNRIVRLNSDGSIDSTFNVGTGFSFTVTSIIFPPDNKILVGGNFTSYNGTPINRIAQLVENT